jgi:hypothetical protein
VLVWNEKKKSKRHDAIHKEPLSGGVFFRTGPVSKDETRRGIHVPLIPRIR